MRLTSRIAVLATILGIALLVRLIDPMPPRDGFFFAVCPVMLVMGVAIAKVELWLGWFGFAGAEAKDP